jgi:IPT/TIG domain/RTX calcium-binding nonapeptide repeat (4 copies)/Beta-propeller repeat/Galactose oxidase, central domain/Kelch motif
MRRGRRVARVGPSIPAGGGDALGAARVAGSLLALALLAAGLSTLLSGSGSGPAREGGPPGSIAAPREAAARAVPDAGTKARATRSIASMPLAFEANDGQTDRRVRFLSRGSGSTVFLTPREAVLSIVRPGAKPGSEPDGDKTAGKGAAIRMKLLGANPDPALAAAKRLPAKSNYFVGTKRHTGVSNYREVTYRSAYPGINVTWHGRQGKLEYDFEVAPGADPSRIAVDFEGAKALELDRRGDLLLRTGAGTVRQPKPVAFQRIGRKRRAVAGRYVLRGNRVGFRLGRYDRSRALVIDPVLSYSTYVGGAGGQGDRGSAIAVDSSGSAYITGQTAAVGFPTTPGSFDTACDQSTSFCTDAFVTKLNAAGTGVVYSTYLGGSAPDAGLGVAIDGAGNAYVTGVALTPVGGTPTPFPTTASTVQRDPPPDDNAFAAKLSPSGASLLYSTFLGGSLEDHGLGIAAGAGGVAWVTGRTESNNFPTKGPLQDTKRGADDVFVTKLDTGAFGADSLLYSTYLGGDNNDQPRGIAVDSGGQAYVPGQTFSTNFPTMNALQPNASASTGTSRADGFVAKLNAVGSGLLYSTYLGGTGGLGGFGPFPSTEQASAIAVDNAGKAYVTGVTDSLDFDTTPGALRATKPTGSTDTDAFVTKLDTAASGPSSLVYSTYFGGNSTGTNDTSEAGRGIAVDPAGNAYVVGATSAVDLPTKDAFQDQRAGSNDAFVMSLDPAGSALRYSSYLGGSGTDEGRAIAIDSGGAAYVTGETSSVDLPTLGFQESASAQFQESSNSARTPFVAKVGAAVAPSPVVKRLAPRSGPTSGGTAVVITGSGFTGASAVSFDGVPATSFTVDSGTQITATSPAHGAGKAVVTVRAGGVGSARNAYAKFNYGEGHFKASGALPAGRNGHTATLLGGPGCGPNCGKVLVAGGRSDTDVESSAALYDPKTGSWAPTGSLATPRTSHDAILLTGPGCGANCGKVLVAGGGVASVELYDPVTGTFAPTGPLAHARRLNTLTALPNGKVLAAGGGSGLATATAEVYDPAVGTWSATATNLTVPRRDHVASSLGDGKVLLVGGQAPASSSPLASAELYDPATNSFTATDPPGIGRFGGATATRLASGAVLVAGGTVFGATGLQSTASSAEVYNPSATPRWSTAFPLVSGRDGHTATLLRNGKVLVAGGEPFGAPAELFDPATRRWAFAGLLRRAASGSTATLLSSDPVGYGEDPAVCGTGCGRVLVVGGRDSTSGSANSDLYTAEPTLGPSSPGGGPSAGGTAVTLTGTGLAAVTQVRFGNKPASSFSVDPGTRDARLVAVAPPGSGTVAVSVQSEGGADSLAGAFTYRAGAAPPPRYYPLPGPGPARGKVIKGTPGNDTLVGTPLDDVITCGAGDDVVIAGGGDDVINCGAGDDRIDAGAGDDRVSGGSGNDRVFGDEGRDAISGGRGNDRISGNDSGDRLSGNSGRDRISGNSGKDRIAGGSGSDRLSGDSGDDRLSGNGGNDRLSGGSGSDRLFGGSGNDVLLGGSGRDRLSGGSGRDRSIQ